MIKLHFAIQYFIRELIKHTALKRSTQTILQKNRNVLDGCAKVNYFIFFLPFLNI